MTKAYAQPDEMTMQNAIAVCEARPADAAWIASFLRAHWRDTAVVVHGEIIDAASLPALIAGRHQGPVPGISEARSTPLCRCEEQSCPGPDPGSNLRPEAHLV